jgi:hypothetical protein
VFNESACCQLPLGPIQPCPTPAGFLDFVRLAMGIPSQALPDGSYWLAFSYQYAMALTSLQLKAAPPPIYTLAVYNLGGDTLVNWAADGQPPFPYPTDNPDGTGYFTYLRKLWNLTGFVPGVIQSSADESTSESLLVPDAFKGMTVSDLNLIKTPWGRMYLGLIQSIGSLWGVT